MQMISVVEENGKMIDFEFDSTPETDAMLKQLCVKECFVRCKDCKYWHTSKIKGSKDYHTCMCVRLGKEGIIAFADDFCSRGVKK